MTNGNFRKGLLVILATLGWFAVISQFYLIQLNSKESFLSTTVNFLSFFTILTNTLVAACVTSLLANSKNLFTREKVIAAIAVYISIVGLVYNLVLRSIWDPQGLQRVTDELLHTIIPLLFIICWIVFVSKKDLQWKDAIAWLAYPLVYSIYTLIHGAISNWYPYPFIDPNNVGWAGVAVNSVYVLLAFLSVSLIFIGLAKFTSRQL